jgi:hypothetical protein
MRGKKRNSMKIEKESKGQKNKANTVKTKRTEPKNSLLLRE